MPKLFFRKKNQKKKTKHSVRDALTPSPAFIAVPSTPPPDKTVNTSKNKSSPSKRPNISLPTLVTSNNTLSNDNASTNKEPQPVANYSLIGHEEGEGEESGAEPGYATVTEVKNRPRLETPRHTHFEEDDSPREAQQDPKAGVALPPLPLEEYHGERRRKIDRAGTLSPEQATPRDVAKNSIECDDVAGELQLPSEDGHKDEQEFVHREERSVKPTTGHSEQHQQRERQREDMYSKVVKPKKQRNVEERTENSEQHHIVADLPPRAPSSSSPMNRRGKDKSVSPLHPSHQKTSPGDSPSPRQQIRPSRQIQYEHHHHSHRILNDSDHRPWTDGGVEHGYKNRSDPNIASIETKRHSYSQPHNRKGTRQRSNTYDAYLRKQPRGEGEYLYDDDINLPLEYTDQSYLPSGEDETETITDSYFDYGGGGGEIPDDYPDGSTHMTPSRRLRLEHGHHHRSRSAPFPSQPDYRSHPVSYPSPHFSRGHSHSPPRRRRKRPATSEEIPLQRQHHQQHSDNIPFIRPPSLQPVYPIPQDQVYVFSQFEPDGRVQYFSATPVHSPPPPAGGPMLSPPPPTPASTTAVAPPTLAFPSNQNFSHIAVQSGIPQRSPSPSKNNVLSVSPHQVRNGEGGEASDDHDGPISSTPTPKSDQAAVKFSRKVPTGVTESGYFSGALGSSQRQQGTTFHNIPQQKQLGGKKAAYTSGGGASSAGHSPHDQMQVTSKEKSRPQPPPPYHQHHNCHLHHHQIHHEYQQAGRRVTASTSEGGRSKSPGGASPSRRLLENSLQRANASPHSEFVSPTTSNLPHSRKSPTVGVPRAQRGSGGGGGTAASAIVSHLSPDNSVMAAAFYEQKEKVMNARIRALEESAEELCTENARLQQMCEVLKHDASGSVEQLQKKLNSVMSENQGYRQMNRDKEQRLGRDKNKILILKDEVEKLREENNQLLLAKQAVELERKEWETVSEHAQSVLDENVTLLKQQDLLKEQMKEMKLQHQAIVSQLNIEVSRGKKERKAVEERLSSLQESHGQLQSQFDKLVEQASQQVSISEHQSALKEMHGLIEDLEERSDSDAKSQEAQLRILMKEKSSLVAKLTDAKTIIIQLEQECTRMHRDIRLAHEKINKQNMDLEESRDREVASHERLSRAVSTAEKAIAEREAFAKIAKAQQKASERAGAQSVLTGVATGKIEKEFETYRQEADAKLEKAATLLREKERENRIQKHQFQREITHLQLQLKTKQKRLDDMAKDKKTAENRLDLMWKAKISKSGLAGRGSSSSTNPVAAAAAASSGTTVNQLQGKLSKLSSHVHPTYVAT